MSDTKNTATAALDVRVYPLKEQKGNLLAFASVNVADCFAVNGVKVLDSEKGLFVAMPQAKDGQGEWRDVCHPTTAEMRKELSNAVLDAYAEAVKDKAQEKASVKEQVKDGAKKAKAQPKKEKPPQGDDAR